jgi:hypothetical protein
MYHPLRTALLAAAAFALALAPSYGQSSTAAVIGLIGKSVTNERRADDLLSEAIRSDTKYFPEIQERFEKVLKVHVQAAHDLRTAFALTAIPPGYDPSAPVAGMSSSQVAAVDPVGFYYAAVAAHQALNDRLRGVLDSWSTNQSYTDSERYRKELDLALSTIVYPRAPASPAP